MYYMYVCTHAHIHIVCVGCCACRLGMQTVADPAGMELSGPDKPP